MFKTLSTRTTTSRFTDQFEGIGINKYCDIEITVEHRLYDSGGEVYHIHYICTYSDNSPLCKTLNPFFGRWDDGSESYECRHEDIIAANEMTENMVKFILMDFDELEKYSGHRTPLSYKISIMRAITFLWD